MTFNVPLQFSISPFLCGWYGLVVMFYVMIFTKTRYIEKNIHENVQVAQGRQREITTKEIALTTKFLRTEKKFF
jgi:hypothetical protein